MKLEKEVKNTILSFNEPFSVVELIQALREKNIMTEENKGEIMRIVDETLESSLVQPITFSKKYYIVSS